MIEKQVKILIVEDEVIVARDIQKMLQTLGYGPVWTAVSGRAAIETARREIPDLILMDIRLKGHIDGIESAMIVKDEMDVPIVYLTAYADQKTLERAKVTEPFGYLLKPFNIRELHSTVEMALYKHAIVKRLKENERWLATTLNSIGDGVIASDIDGKVVLMNTIAEQLTGWKFEEAKGIPVSQAFRILAGDGGEPLEVPGGDAGDGGFSVFPEGSVLEACDGHLISIEGNIDQIKDETGKASGAVVVFRDVTDRQEMEKQLEYAREMKVFGQIAANVAHEVRNPLNAILAITEALFQDIGEDTEYGPYLVHIKSQVNRLSRLMKDLLDLGKPLQSASIQPESIENICRSTINLWNETDVSHNYTVQLESSPAITDKLVMADSARLQQVFINLLDNAVHHSEKGSDIRIALNERQDGHLAISFHDTGTGIAQQNLDKIFEPFFTTRRGGTGLGLSIVKHFVESMGGNVSVRNNDPGPGCTVEIGLPAYRGGSL